MTTDLRERFEAWMLKEALPRLRRHQLRQQLARVSAPMKVAARVLEVPLPERDTSSQELEAPVELEKW